MRDRVGHPRRHEDSRRQLRGPEPRTEVADAASRLLQVQRSAGNAATGYVLRQRQADAGPLDAAVTNADAQADGPLDQAQVTRAIRYHQRRGEQYTPAVVEQIQQQVGADHNGRVGAATVQAIARWQQLHPSLANSDIAGLIVDGMAGPRTLGIMFRSGLSEASAADGFSHHGAQVRHNWSALGSADERLRALAQPVRQKLEDQGVPVPDFNAEDTESRGYFTPSLWTITVQREQADHPEPSREQMKSFMETVYHEARHCEQFFEMARVRAGAAITADAIADEMDIPVDIADAAHANPLQRGSPRAALAEGWYEDTFGDASARMWEIFDEARAAVYPWRAAVAAHREQGTAATLAEVEATEPAARAALALYRTVPIEFDAHFTHHLLWLPLLDGEVDMSGDPTALAAPAPNYTPVQRSAAGRSNGQRP